MTVYLLFRPMSGWIIDDDDDGGGGGDMAVICKHVMRDRSMHRDLMPRLVCSLFTAPAGVGGETEVWP